MLKNVKIVSGFNNDLIGKQATVTSEMGDGMVEVIVKGRESQRYVIPANTVVNLDNEPKVVESVSKTPDTLKPTLQKMIASTENLLNELKTMYDSIN